MTSEASRAGRCCPYCQSLQVPDAAPVWRCPGCNLYVRSADLVAPDEYAILDDVCREFCPWCAFPMAQEFSLPESEEFRCTGCEGLLTAELLVSPADIERYRKKRMSSAGYLVFFLVLLAVIGLTVLLMQGG